jgi:(E)-4-hydroxy-3-methylbut-2-enyl-diphosphate synthase
VARQILANLEDKPHGPNLVACPTCGRLEIDMFPMVKRVEEAMQGIRRTITVSVMGCVVNGPGEGMHADIGIAGGKHKGALFKSGRVVASLPEAELIDILIAELRAVAAEDAELLAAGKPLPEGLSDGAAAPEPPRPMTPLTVV